MPEALQIKSGKLSKWRNVRLPLARPICSEPITVAAPDEDDRWPRSALYRDGLAAFCEVHINVRRAQLCREILRRRLVLPTGPFSWESTCPELDTARLIVERVRPALLIGFYGPLEQKDNYGRLERESYHDRAIREAEPLVNALLAIQLEEWSKMSGDDRRKLAWSLPEINDYHMTNTSMDFAFMEAERASKLLRLSPENQRIIIDGSYACRRLDALDESAMAGEEARQERAAHEVTIKNLCNDIGQHDLAEKIEATINDPARELSFPKCVLYDRFKGHLIDAIKQRWSTKDIKLGTSPSALSMSSTGSPAETAEMEPAEQRPLAAGPKKRKRTGKYLKDKPLTNAQKQAVKLLAVCKGSKTEAAKRLGISRAALDDRLHGVMLRGEMAHRRSVRAKSLPTDRRGQAIV